MTCPTCVAARRRRARRAGRGLPRPAAAARPLLRRRGRRADRAALHRRLAPGAGARGPRRLAAAPAGHVGAARARASSSTSPAPSPASAAGSTTYRRSGSPRGCGRSGTRDHRPTVEPRTFAERRSARAPDGRVVGARPGQPHRRAHRLQRRALPADRAAAAHRRAAVRPRRRPHRARVVRAGRTSVVELRPRRRRARHPGGLGGLRRRRLLGPGAGRAPGVRRSTSSSTAACRWVPACRARPRSSAPSPWRCPTCAGSACWGRRRRPGPARPRSASSAENTIAQAPTGGMDQSASLRCTAGHALLLDCRDGSVEQVPFDLGRARPRAARHRHPRRARPGRRPVRRSGDAAASRPPRELGVASLREVAVRLPRGGAGPASPTPCVRRRARHVVTEIERVRQTRRACCAEDRLEEVGAALRRLARLDARRLRDLRAPSSTSRWRRPWRTARSAPG